MRRNQPVLALDVGSKRVRQDASTLGSTSQAILEAFQADDPALGSRIHVIPRALEDPILERFPDLSTTEEKSAKLVVVPLSSKHALALANLPTPGKDYNEVVLHSHKLPKSADLSQPHKQCGQAGTWNAPSDTLLHSNGLDVSDGALLATYTESLEVTSPIPSETEEIAALKKEMQELTEEIKHQIHRRCLNDKHIQWLHAYNEIKDVSQGLLGQLALHQGGVTKDMYQEYGLELDD